MQIPPQSVQVSSAHTVHAMLAPTVQRGPGRQASQHSFLSTAFGTLHYCRHKVQGGHGALLPACSTTQRHSRSFWIAELVNVDWPAAAGTGVHGRARVRRYSAPSSWFLQHCTSCIAKVLLYTCTKVSDSKDVLRAAASTFPVTTRALMRALNSMACTVSKPLCSLSPGILPVGSAQEGWTSKKPQVTDWVFGYGLGCDSLTGASMTHA